MDSLARNLKGQFKYADRVNARKTIVIGDDELESGQATVKDMESGEQKTVAFEDITALLK